MNSTFGVFVSNYPRTLIKQDRKMAVKRQCLAQTVPEDWGVTQQKPKYPQYTLLTKRKESFATWPADSCISADKLAECGLVYTGTGDSVRCYYCGGGLRNWDPEDDPWVEHARSYPTCPHVSLVKGQGFIDRVHNSYSELALQTTENGIDSVAALSCLQMGFQQSKVSEAIRKYISIHGHSNYKGEDLCKILLDEEEMATDESESRQDLLNSYNETEAGKLNRDQCKAGEAAGEEIPESFEELYEENCRLKEHRLCKICMDGTANIIFLPCGHMFSCPQCAPSITMCSVCRKAVNGFVKAYFSN